MIVGGQTEALLTIIDYHEQFDQGFTDASYTLMYGSHSSKWTAVLDGF